MKVFELKKMRSGKLKYKRAMITRTQGQIKDFSIFSIYKNKISKCFGLTKKRMFFPKHSVPGIK